MARQTYFAQYKGAAAEGVGVFSGKEAQEAEVCYETVTGGIGAEQAELERLLKSLTGAKKNTALAKVRVVAYIMTGMKNSTRKRSFGNRSKK